MLKAILMLFAVFLANSCLAQNPNSYEGIWQDKEDSSHYYAINENGNSLVLINLAGIEESGNTLKSSYIGNKSDLVMTRVSPNIPAVDIFNQLKLEFQSLSEGVVYPKCDACSVRVIKIRKIF